MSEDKSEALREAKKKYFKNWRAKNPEKVAAIQERYWRRKLEEQKQAVSGVPEKTEIR